MLLFVLRTLTQSENGWASSSRQNKKIDKV